MKKTIATKIGAAAFSGAFAVTGVMAGAGMVPVLAAPSDSSATNNNTAEVLDMKDHDSDIIDNSQKGSITIHKYDITAAEAAGDWEEGRIKATGQEDTAVSDTLKDYAIEGVEFSYLKVGEIETYSNTTAEGSEIVVVYEIPKELQTILNRTGKLPESAAYDVSKATAEQAYRHAKEGVLHYTSTQINDALEDIINNDDIISKNALESYLRNYNTQITDDDDSTANTPHSGQEKAVAMPVTDANGVTSASDLPLGLYLIVETRVPEEVTETVNPWFISLPFTNTSIQEENPASASSTEHKDNDVNSTDNSGGDYWLYNAFLYPKNQTGNPTIDKSVRNAYSIESINSNKGRKNDGVDSANSYESALKGKLSESGDDLVATAAANAGKKVIVFNQADGDHTKDTDAAKYVENRGGYTASPNNVAAEGEYSKDFKYGDVTTASEGDVLDYIVVSKLPHITSKATYLSKYTFTDNLGPGITYNNDPRIAFYDNKTDAESNNTKNAVLIWEYDAQSGKFTGDPSTSTKDIFADGNVTENPDGSRMTISLTEAGLNVINAEVDKSHLGIGDGVDSGLSDYYMVLYYTATVESNDQVTLGDEGNVNDVALVWSRTNNDYDNSLQDRNYVYTYGVDLTKTFSKEADATAANFAKVEFKLYNDTDAYYILASKDADGVYHVTGKTTSKSEATTLVPSAEGKLYVKGLEADKYQLTEVHTADGYTLLRDEVEIGIVSTERDVKASVAGTVGLDAQASANIIDNYGSGIRNEDGQLVDEASTDVGSKAVPGPKAETANGRTIGKTDMYVGDIQPATATVDGQPCTMLKSSTGNRESANAEVKLNVVNNKNWVLPATGGMGTYAATIAGIVILGMGVYSINKKRETV